MNKHRYVPLALVACAAGLSLAACSAGVTAASSSPAAPKSTASTAATASSAAATKTPSAVRNLGVDGSIGSFPIPSGAKVDENVTDDKTIVIIFGSVTPAEVSHFYAAALPRAGYTITLNVLDDANGGTVAEVSFTGHGYKGNISALSKAPASDVSMAGVSNKNFTGITLSPQ
jgi:hypothetical protein